VTNVTRALAQFTVETAPGDVPAAVVHEGKRALLHWLGCAVGGSHEESVTRALAAIRPISGPPQANVLGRSEQLDVLHAAFINGVSTDVLSFSDTHPETLIHPTGVIGPVVLALAQTRSVSGSELLHALILGFEVASRVSLAVYPWHYDRGWHITGTAGAFGAAAAAGRVLGLDEQRLTWALGIAAAEAAGLRGMFGSMCKNLHSGRAAENGLLAAFLARERFTSVDDGIGGPRCFAHVLGETPDLERAVRGLGSSYEISRNTYKAFPCGVVIHPIIDACLRLRRASGFEVTAIEAVEVRANPLVIELTGRTAPVSTLEGKLSAYHGAAAALVAGRVGEQEFDPGFIARADVLALRAKVRIETDPATREGEARVTLRMKSGQVLNEHVEHAVGTEQRPMTDAEIETKFTGLCEPYLAPEQMRKLVDCCWSVESLTDAGMLARLASKA
jgi:2-methylcitrate dehydratase PrpD